MCIKKTQSCPPFTKRQGTKCQKYECAKDYKWVAEKKKCVRSVCPDDNYSYDATINKCVWNKCIDTSFTYNKETKKCEKKECKDKDQGFVFDPKKNICVKKICEPGFIYDLTNGLCKKTYCKDGYVLEMTTKKCVLIKTVAPLSLVDPSDLTLTSNVDKMLLWFGKLEEQTQTDVYGCNLNLQPAMQRCENDHGKGGCQKVTATFVNKKCPEGTIPFGASKCVVKCPNEWRFDEKGLFCSKRHSYRVDQYDTEDKCKKNKWWTKCVSTAAGKFVPVCKEGYTKTGSDLCRPSCPKNWSDLGTMCVKPPATDLGLPYTWANGDK